LFLAIAFVCLLPLKQTPRYFPIISFINAFDFVHLFYVSFQISKDVRALRKFESSLLGAYQRFIHFLLACLQPLKLSLYQKVDGEKQVAKRMKKKRRVLVAKGLSHEQAEKIVSMEQQSQSAERVAVAAANALARLLSSIPHFNYTKDIITHTVPLINHSNEQVSAAVASACQSVFVNDVAGQVTVEIMRLLGKLAKEKPMHLSPKLLTTFLHLKLQHNIIYLGMSSLRFHETFIFPNN
jgi:muconolactone delta-isomerase